MPYFQASIGVNIEKDRLSLVYLKRSFKGVSLAGHGIYRLEKKEAGEKAAEISRVVNEFLQTHGILSADIFLGIQRDLAIVRYIELPLAVRENLAGAIRYEMEKYVPLPVSDIYFDFQIISEDRAAGRLKVMLIAVKKEFLDPYLGGENRLGAGISGIEINSTALVNFFSCPPVERDADLYAFLSVKDEHFELGLVRKKLLHYSRHVTVDKTDDNLPAAVSEELNLLKKTLGSEQERLETVLCGSGGGIAELLQEREDIDFFSPDLSETGLPSEALAPAYGLALRGMRKTPMDINLLPAGLRKKISKAAYYTMVALAGLLLASVIVWGGSNITHQRHVAAGLQSELKRLGAEVEAVNQTRESLRELERRMDALNEIRRRHVPVLNVLQELSREIPPGAWFDRLSITDRKGDLEGYADSASALITVMAESPLLKDAAFLSPITKDRDGKERFRIGFSVR